MPLSLPRTLGKAKASKSFRELFAKTRSINLMAAARIFLFGSRDVWFVVGLPVFLYSQGWRYMEVAGFIASWTIGYGLVQAIAPSVIRRSADGLSREVPEARLWGAVLTAIPLVLALVLGSAHVARLDLVVTIGLGVFGFAFAVISSLHSYLILAYAGSEKAAEDVGFYYAANAGGRLIGHSALQKLSEDLYSEFDPSSPAHWATTNPVDRLALVDRRRGGSNQPIQHLIRDVRNVWDRGLSIVGVTRVMAGVKLGQNVNTVR